MNCNEVVKILDLILDCEATNEQKDHFFKHLDECSPCFEHYELDRVFKEFVARHNNSSTDCCSKELIEQIRIRISSESL